jgi:hypothetical protein
VNGVTVDQGATALPSSAAGGVVPTVGSVVMAGATTGQGSINGEDVVVITGTGFTSDSQVSFDGVAAESTIVASSTQIIAVTPAHSAGTVHVTVTNAAGTSATSAEDGFAYDDPSQGSGGGGTTTGTSPPVTTGGSGDGRTTGLIVPGLDPSKIEYFLGLLRLANDTEQNIAIVKERLAQSKADAKNAFWASSRKAAAAKVLVLEQALQSLTTDMATYKQAFSSGGFDDLLTVGFPQGLTDELQRGSGAGGVGFEGALLAYQTALTHIQAQGLEQTDGPLEFVITAVGPGLIAKGINSAAMPGLKYLASVLTAIRTEGHHAIPKFLGGFVKQTLSRLPSEAHKEFHAVLRQELKAAGIPLNVGGRGGGTRDWLAYLARNPGSQRKAFDAVLKAAREIDFKYGTEITETFWKNLIEGRLAAFP